MQGGGERYCITEYNDDRGSEEISLLMMPRSK